MRRTRHRIYHTAGLEGLSGQRRCLKVGRAMPVRLGAGRWVRPNVAVAVPESPGHGMVFAATTDGGEMNKALVLLTGSFLAIFALMIFVLLPRFLSAVE